MINREFEIVLNKVLSSGLNEKTEIKSVSNVGGGSINRAYQLKSNKKSFFLKVNDANLYPGMFDREYVGLKILSSTGIITLPKPISTGVFERKSYILMSWLEQGSPKKEFWADFGQKLAELHQLTSDKFGLEENNYIGSLPQNNNKHENWSSFFIHERIEPLVKKASELGRLDSTLVRQFDKLFVKLEHFFPIEKPSLIHGDLWSGNFMCAEDGFAAIFDPAVYYGHREMDIAMSKLFGGFSPEFYQSYNETWPMEKGWEARVDVANLYPLLVHVILFGGSYGMQVKGILQRFGG